MFIYLGSSCQLPGKDTGWNQIQVNGYGELIQIIEGTPIANVPSPFSKHQGIPTIKRATGTPAIACFDVVPAQPVHMRDKELNKSINEDLPNKQVGSHTRYYQLAKNNLPYKSL